MYICILKEIIWMSGKAAPSMEFEIWPKFLVLRKP
jgi:hypothetical protein